mmetsp:Transcript_41198/g.92516  ORF Transcript_41198/g.92516 Transcript_41198/m.92516 type:complete len:378 (-) Transcript_41198:88-1221(-)
MTRESLSVQAQTAKSEISHCSTAKRITETVRFAAQALVEPHIEDDDDEFFDARSDLSPSASARSNVEAMSLEAMRASLRLTCEVAGRVPDDFLRKCLVYQKWDIEAALSTAKGFLTFRRSAGWSFQISAWDVERPLRSGLHWLLWPQRTMRSCRGGLESVSSHQWEDGGPGACLLFNMSRLNPDVCCIAEYQKMSMFLMERAIDDATTLRRGIAVVADFKGVVLSNLLRVLSLDDIRRGVLLWKGAFPCRMRRIWIVDAPLGIRRVAQAVVQLLHPKLRTRIRFASRSVGLSPLVQDLGDIFALPLALGGDAEVEWEHVVESYLAAEKQQRPDHLAPHQKLASSCQGEGATSSEGQSSSSWLGSCCFRPYLYACASD